MLLRVDAALRAATPADLEPVRRLLDAAELPTAGLEQQFGASFVVAEAEGRVVAAAGVEVWGEHGLLRSVVVDPAWRGRGLGEALVEDRVAWAGTRGLRGLYLLTTTAEGFFPRAGFRRVPRDAVPAAVRLAPEFASLCPASAAAMALGLPRAAARGDGDSGQDSVAGRAGASVGAKETAMGSESKGKAGGAGGCCGGGGALLNVAPRAGKAEVVEEVRARYAAAALRVREGAGGCCGGGTAADCSPITADLYDRDQSREVPEDALKASLGCGNPTALAQLRPGQVVLDLGSGGGIDVLLSARRVGPTGKAYGLNMTDEMLALARENQRQAGVSNVEFLKGRIEQIPLPDASVDVIISNCVINLSVDKGRVLAEAFRVLKPGGMFAISDVVVRGEIPEPIRRSVELWAGCIAGALEVSEYERLLRAAGFEQVSLEPTRVYSAQDAQPYAAEAGLDDAALAAIDGRFMSAFVRAIKPQPAAAGGAGARG